MSFDSSRFQEFDDVDDFLQEHAFELEDDNNE